MDPEYLIGSVLKQVLGGRRKRGRKASSYLTGGSGSLLNAGTLLAAAGVVWGLYETMKNQGGLTGVSTGGSVPPPATAPGAPPAYAASEPSEGGIVSGTGVMPPPLPSTSAGGRGASWPGISDAAARVLRLTISAARADGTLSDDEQAKILAEARAAGADTLVERELREPHALADIVAGVADPAERADLYRLGFAVVRGDESVTGGERIYLAQLAHALGLDPETARRLEEETASSIDAQ